MEERLESAWDKMIEQLGSWLDVIVVSLPNVILAIIVFAGSFFLSRYVNSLMLRLLAKSSMQGTVKKVSARLISVTVILAGLFLALGILNLNKVLTSLLAGAGVAGLAIGLALQGTIANTFSGIVLSFVDYIKMGDWIECNDYSGEVVDIDLRTVTIREKDNNMVSIPNKMVIENPLKNYSITSKTRISVSCGVAYDSDLEFVQELVIKTISEKFDSVKNKEEVIFFYTEFDNSSINFETRFWMNSTTGLQTAKAKGDAIIAIKKAFDANGITIPFPIRTIDFSNKLSIKNQKNSNEEDSQEGIVSEEKYGKE
ncbi:small-conductance mechanosensitive channel [Galbibacter orientalis DSM 19592]|uniref:Small-conductance mechanosensitive channel n=1 Tax=Galbibacter orientalis DSM 19592 TaxID=926559 RepID=I3C103_9FLAO|nr:mechanosensitive ion channel domain-containing protein [Galbibacter orientalis]EIJ37296.1 small-conductance mechanosensitive channel [Galbibacter orientalis DSM 19592]